MGSYIRRLYDWVLGWSNTVLTQLSIAARGDSPVPVGSYFSTSGNNTGKSSSLTALYLSPTCTIGNGSPQYL